MAPTGILVSDFDGTMTGRDFFRLVLGKLPPSCAAWWEEYEQGALTHFEALAKIFAALRCSRREMDELVAAMEPEPGLREGWEDLSAAGWKLIVASAGCGWYIGRILAAAGIDPEVHTNPGTFEEGEGLQMRLPEDSPFFHRLTGIDKGAVVRGALSRTDRVAFAGDGRPDLEPSLLVPPRLRFARGWLAGELARRGEPFVHFERWREIPGHLLRVEEP